MDQIRLDRVTLTKQQMRATEIMLYRTADLVNRLLADNGVQYTKIEVPPAGTPPLVLRGETGG